tara:strand:- start:4528 stop:5406 length:879 start_codon:yes stop_codon:yes gene_type:complete
MKKLLYLLFVITILSCNNDNKIQTEDKLAIDSLSLELQLREDSISVLEKSVLGNDSLINQYALYIKKIKDNLAEIEKQEKFLNSASSDSEQLKEDTLNIINAIDRMAGKIQENEYLINKLNSGLEKSKSQNMEFRKEIAHLNQLIAISNREVYFLKEELSSLNNSFNTIFEKYNSQKIQIKDLNSALNEVAYVVGSKTELLQNGVLTKEGGIIGIGKSRKLSHELNTNYFTISSKKEFKSIVLGVKSLKIVTPHSSKSYKLFKSEKGKIDSLVVLSADEFWKNSKYLVIEVR